MIEMITMILNIITAVVFVTCIIYWFRIGLRLSKVIDKVEKDFEPDKIDRSELDESENIF